jgi:hypothetical protein
MTGGAETTELTGAGFVEGTAGEVMVSLEDKDLPLSATDGRRPESMDARERLDGNLRFGGSYGFGTAEVQSAT